MSSTKPKADASNRADDGCSGNVGNSNGSKKRPRAGPDTAAAAALASASASASQRPPVRTSSNSNSNSKPLAPRKERLPYSILPNSGAVKIRKAVEFANLYPRPSGRIKKKHATGQIRHTETEWRSYTSVYYDEARNEHFLEIALTGEERRKAAAASPARQAPTHGWARYENIAKPIPPNKTVRESRFVQRRKSVVLISLFDGIGGGRLALDGLRQEYNVVATFSSEKDRTAKAVVQRYDPTIVDLPDVEKIDHEVVRRVIFGNRRVREAVQCAAYGDELHFIVIAGPPCQDLSQANKSSTGFVKGALAGERSRLFFHVPRIVKMISDSKSVGVWSTHYIVENVEMTERNQSIFTEFLGHVKPWKVDFNDGGACASLMSRRRLYFSSVMPGGGQIGLGDFAQSGCIHPAKNKGMGVDAVLSKLGWGDWKFVNAPNGTLPTLTRRKTQGGQDRYRIQRRDGAGEIRDAPQIINEDLLGFPLNHTRVGPDGRLLNEAERRLLLGNSFCVFHVRYLLKEMHSRICEPSMLEQNGGKYIQYLPQDLCRYKLRPDNRDLSRDQRKFYEEVQEVVTDILKFDEYEKRLEGTMYQYL